MVTPPSSGTIRITGYGIDRDNRDRSPTQQTHTGAAVVLVGDASVLPGRHRGGRHRGAAFFNQAIVIDQSANAAGFTTSNAARAVIGGIY